MPWLARPTGEEDSLTEFVEHDPGSAQPRYILIVAQGTCAGIDGAVGSCKLAGGPTCLRTTHAGAAPLLSEARAVRRGQGQGRGRGRSAGLAAASPMEVCAYMPLGWSCAAMPGAHTLL